MVLAVCVAWLLMVYVIFPAISIEITGVQSTGFILQAVFIVISLIILFYLLFKRYYSKIKAEKDRNAETIARYDALSAATHDAIWDHDLITGKTFYNQRIREVFGYNDEDLKDNEKWWSENIHPDDRERVKGKIENILTETKSFWQDEYKFRCKNGEYKIVYDRSYIVRNSQGKPTRLIGAMIDISEARSMDEKILQKKLLHKNNLGRAIIQAHEEERKHIKEELHEDVNQVLAAIKLYIQQVHTSKGQTEVLQHSLSQLDDAITKINKISNQLLPSGLQFFGLISSLQDLVTYNNSAHKMNIELDLEHFEENNMNEALRLLVFRVVQDLLINTLSGPKPQKIAIRIRNGINKVEVLFTDDAAVKTESELVEMRKLDVLQNKLELYDGTLTLHKKTNNQVKVEVDL